MRDRICEDRGLVRLHTSEDFENAESLLLEVYSKCHALQGSAIQLDDRPRAPRSVIGSLSSRIQLSLDNASLRKQNREMRQKLESHIPTETQIVDVLKITKEIFPGSVITFDSSSDPDCPEFEYAIVMVRVDIPVDSRLALRKTWHAMVASAAPGLKRLRLELNSGK